MNKISPKTCKMVRTIYGWVFSAFTIVIGALFIWQVLDIYLGGTNTGQRPFSYELVSYRIKSVIAIPFWIWIAAIVVGLIVWEVFPVKEKLAPINDARYVMYRLSKRIPATVGEDLKSSADYVQKQQKKLKIIHWCLLGVVALFVIYMITYVCIPSNFTGLKKNAPSEIVTMAAFILPVAAIVYLAGCAYVILLNKSAKNMLPHVKKLTAGVKAAQPVQPNKFTKIVTHKYFKLGVRIAIACFGVAFVITGCFTDSIKEVFDKAIRICTECIGLG